MKWLLLIRDWWRARREQSYRPRYTIPDILEIHMADARNAVKLEKEKQRLIEAKAKTAKMEAEQTIK